MKLSFIHKLLALFLIIMFSSHFPYVHAYTGIDPNKPVSDLFEKDDKTNSEEEIKPDTKEPTTDVTASHGDVGSSPWDYIRVFVALLFVIGLLIGLLKFINKKNKKYDKNRFMKNMGGLSLGQNKSIQLVVIGDTHYLVGVGEDIRLLKEITDLTEIKRLTSYYDIDESALPTGLLEQLLSKLGSIGTKKKSIEPVAKTTDFNEILQNRLDEMKEERKRHIARLTEKERDLDD